MGIVLSHTTARAVYQTANSLASYAIDPLPMEKIRVSAPTTSDLEAARAWLNRKNVDSESIHVLTFPIMPKGTVRAASATARAIRLMQKAT